ncbi:hypothetical protein BDR22DRAFT_893808 [Usnea florida]
MAQKYVHNLRDILSKPKEWNNKIMFLSSVTGGVLSPKFLTPEYWARNLTDPVLFSEAFETMCRSDANVDFVVEIGAHSTLAAPIRQLLSGQKLSYVPCLKKLTDAVETMQDLVCELLARGYPVDLKAVNSPSGEEEQAFTPAFLDTHGTTARDIGRVRVSAKRLNVDSKIVLPAAAYISMAIEAVRFLTKSVSTLRAFRLRQVNVKKALTIPESSGLNLLDGLTAGGKTITSLSISNVVSKVSDYVIHPTTFETVIQAAFDGLPNELIQTRIILPRSIGNIFVSCDLNSQAVSRLKAFTDLRKLSRRGFATNLAVSGVNGDGSMSPYLRMEDLYCQAVPADLRNVTEGREPPFCFKSLWEHDILHQIPTAVKDSMKNILSDEETKFETKLLRFAYHFIYDAVAELKDKDRASWAWYYNKYYDWMEHIVALGISGALSPGCKAWPRSSNGRK